MTAIKLTTSRLTLRLAVLSDLEAIHILHSLPETDRFNTLGIPKDVHETKSILEDWINESQKSEPKSITFVIEDISTRKFIGLIALKVGSKKFRIGEVWYKLHSDFWGKGYATEALNGILSFGFDNLKLHRIEAGCAIDNIGSIRVLERVGMTREGRKRQVLPLKTGWSDNFEFAILESDKRKN